MESHRTSFAMSLKLIFLAVLALNCTRKTVDKDWREEKASTAWRASGGEEQCSLGGTVCVGKKRWRWVSNLRIYDETAHNRRASKTVLVVGEPGPPPVTAVGTVRYEFTISNSSSCPVWIDYYPVFGGPQNRSSESLVLGPRASAEVSQTHPIGFHYDSRKTNEPQDFRVQLSFHRVVGDVQGGGSRGGSIATRVAPRCPD